MQKLQQKKTKQTLATQKEKKKKGKLFIGFRKTHKENKPVDVNVEMEMFQDESVTDDL